MGVCTARQCSNNTLSRLLSNEEAIRALESIEGFRGVKQDMETIISKSEAVKNTRKEFANSDKEIDKETKKTLSDDEKEYKSKRKVIQEKLIKFATEYLSLCIYPSIENKLLMR